jgi:hypothetical protein
MSPLTTKEKADKYDSLAQALWYQVVKYPKDSSFARRLIEIHEIPDPDTPNIRVNQSESFNQYVQEVLNFLSGKKTQEIAWELYCNETAGSMDVRDFWEELPETVQQLYLQKAEDSQIKGPQGQPTIPLHEESTLYGADPNCNHRVYSANGGGIKCAKCTGWFCY